MVHDHISTVVIVGGGQAAVEIAFGLRDEGYEGRVVVVSEESHPPYQRPPLSKDYLTGGTPVQDLYFRSVEAYEEVGIELILSTRVIGVDRVRRRIQLDRGEELVYDRLALAVGGRARHLPILDQAANHENVHYVRTIPDTDRLREQARPGQRVVVVGGGYVGLESAAALVGLGAQVTIVEAMPRVLARVTAPHVSQFYETVHRAHGVDVITGATVVAASVDEQSGRVSEISLDTGARLPTDVLVVGIGLVPATELAEACGLVVDDGIVVDETCRTSDEHIYAAGDCTKHPSTRHGGGLVRVESVSNAIDQGRVVARRIAGQPATHEAVPWFWSDQYDVKLHMVGQSAGCDEMVTRGSADEKSFSTFYLADGHLIGGDFVNRAADFAWTRRLMDRGAEVSAAVLADETVPLKSFLARTAATR